MPEDLGRMVRVAHRLRIASVVPSVLWLVLARPPDTATLAVLLSLAVVLSGAPLLMWDRVGDSLVEHPLLTGADYLLAIATLATAGLDSPFLLFVVATTVLAGLLHDAFGAVASSLGLLLVLALPFTAGAGGAPSWTVLLGVPLLLPVGGAVGVLLRRQAVAQQQHRELLALRARDEARRAERNRVGREVHDRLGKALNGIALGAASLPRLMDVDPVAARTLASVLVDGANDAVRDVRGVITDLRRQQVSEPLHAELHQRARAWAGATGIELRLALAPVDTDDDARYELVCLLEESLRNVAQHAAATRVQITLETSAAGGVRLRIRDDGLGFDAERARAAAVDGHIGLASLRERAEVVGGTCEVRSTPGRGTEVMATVPYRSASTSLPTARPSSTSAPAPRPLPV